MSKQMNERMRRVLGWLHKYRRELQQARAQIIQLQKEVDASKIGIKRLKQKLGMYANDIVEYEGIMYTTDPEIIELANEVITDKQDALTGSNNINPTA